MNGKSVNISDDNLQKFKQLFPQVFKEDKINFDLLKTLLGEEVLAKNETYGLSWTGKYDAFKEIQKETSATLIPDVENSIDFENTQNVFIEGENLEVLRVLQKSYYGKIKMIYIDPPYNTGKDKVFGYSDNFHLSKSNYLNKTGKSDENGLLNEELVWKRNSSEGGQYHSSWLNMMYSRMYLAKNLLTDDGIFFASIDDNEVFNLKLLLDDIYGQENFIGQFIWINRTTPNDASLGFASDHEYILMYAKNKEQAKFKGIEKDFSNYKNKDSDPKGDWIPDNPSAASGNAKYRFPIENPYTKERYFPPQGRYWAFSPKRIEEWTKSGKLVFPREKGKNFVLKKYKSELKSNFKPISSIINGLLTSKGTKELKQLFPGGSPFKYPKPTELIKLLIEQTTHNDDIILDFFAGSGTTGHAVFSLNHQKKSQRKFICVQLNEEFNPSDEIYKENFKFISDITRSRLTKASDFYLKKEPKNLKKIDYGFKFFKLQKSNFKIWRTDIKNEKELIEQLEEFKNPENENSKDLNIVFEFLLKQGLRLNSKIEKIKLEETSFFVINKTELAISTTKIDEQLLAKIIEIKPKIFICLDKLFRTNDQLKTNISLILKKKNIIFQSEV